VSPALEIMGMEMPRLAKRAARESGTRLMVHIGDTEKRYDAKVIHSLLPLLDKGDILTHLFTANPGGVLDGNGQLVPEACAVRAGPACACASCSRATGRSTTCSGPAVASRRRWCHSSRSRRGACSCRTGGRGPGAGSQIACCPSVAPEDAASSGFFRSALCD